MSVEEHKGKAPGILRFSIITISDRCSAGKAEDLSGRFIHDTISKGNVVADYRIIPDELDNISETVTNMIPNCDCIITTGGTGVSKRDVTIGAVRPILDKELPGFGELFRMLSYEEIGTATIMSGALAGISDDCVIFCLPGSMDAVKLSMKIILSESYHIIKHLRE